LNWDLELVDERDFARKIVKIHKTLSYMEKSKYLEPFLSQTVDKLVEHFKG
jgi:hypothetical protein